MTLKRWAIEYYGRRTGHVLMTRHKWTRDEALRRVDTFAAATGPEHAIAIRARDRLTGRLYGPAVIGRPHP